MGVRQAMEKRSEDNMKILPLPMEKENLSQDEEKEKWFQMIHPSITYKIIKLLRENLNIGDEPIVEGRILWNPCEDEKEDKAAHDITGIVEYRIGYMLAAAIMGDQKKILQGAGKGYSLTGSDETEMFHWKKACNRSSDTLYEFGVDEMEFFWEDDFVENIFVRCRIEDGNGESCDMVKILEYSLWGMILWPVWETENDLHRTLWKILKTEYQNAGSSRRWEIKRVILNSIDSLYIQKYQEKAMDICERVFPEAFDVQYKNWIPENLNEHKKRNCKNQKKRDKEPDMEWDMSIVDSWTQMTVLTRYHIFCAIDRYTSKEGFFVLGSWISEEFIREWTNNGRRKIETAEKEIKEEYIFYAEKPWKINGITFKPWKNKIWAEDKISRYLETMEKMEFESEKNGDKLHTRFLFALRLLDGLLRTGDRTYGYEGEMEEWMERKRIQRYASFLSSLWDETVRERQARRLSAKTEEIWVGEIKKRICETDKETENLKDACVEIEVELKGKILPEELPCGVIDLEQCLQKLLFYKNELVPTGKLTVNVGLMEYFHALHYAIPASEPTWLSELTFDSSGVATETDGIDGFRAGKCEKDNELVKKIWKIMDFYIEDEYDLCPYQKKILDTCKEEDFLYARFCGLFPDHVLNEAKLYAAEIENLKILPALICLTAKKK